MHGLVALDEGDGCCARRSSGTIRRTAPQCESSRRGGPVAAHRPDGNRASDRLHGAQAAVAAPARAGDCTPASARCCCPRTTCVSGSAASVPRTSPTPRARAARRGRTPLERECWRRWSSPAAWLPPVLEAARSRGAPRPASPWAAGAGDQAAAALGVGIVEPDGAALGRAGHVGRGVRRAAITFAADPLGRLHAFCHAVPGGWHVMGVMLSAAGSLRWLRDASSGRVVAALVDEAAAREPGAEGLLFAPYLAGERTHARRRTPRRLRRPLPAPRPRRARPRRARGRRLRAARLAGAAARAGLEHSAAGASAAARARGCGCSIAASILGVPLELRPCEEGSAYGAALLGGVSGRGRPRRRARARRPGVRVRETASTRSRRRAAYEQGYARLHEARRRRCGRSPSRAGGGAREARRRLLVHGSAPGRRSRCCWRTCRRPVLVAQGRRGLVDPQGRVGGGRGAARRRPPRVRGGARPAGPAGRAGRPRRGPPVRRSTSARGDRGRPRRHRDHRHRVELDWPPVGPRAGVPEVDALPG